MDLLEVILAKDKEQNGSPADTIKRALQAVRAHLGMEIAYVSEFVGNESVFRAVDAPGLEAMIKTGDSRSLDHVYCRHILEGRLPELMADTSQHPLAMAMPITSAVPIGAHMSVPIRLRDGSPYGMFCCLSPQPNRSLNDRDLQMMKAFADLTAYQIQYDVDHSRALDEKRSRIETVLKDRSFFLQFQPIWNFQRETPAGFECLTRFTSAPLRSPDKWFNEAAEVGKGIELERAAIEAALEVRHLFRQEAYLAVNASPQTILSDGFSRLFPAGGTGGTDRIVLEVTEHAPVEDYAQLEQVLDRLRKKGIRLAIDDAGAGYSSLRHIIQLRPDIIKLDITLTRNVNTDPARRALASALIFFARETGCQIVAEGIETADELDTLKALGINGGQGYLLGRPSGLEDALALLAPRGEKRA